MPLSHFIEKPFQNWTREGAALIGTVFLYSDFTVPVAALRKKLEEVARASKLWDGQVVKLQVTDLKESAMKSGCLSAHTTRARRSTSGAR